MAVLQSALLLSSCLDASRLNTSCEWIGDTTVATLDMAIAAGRRHLANDARIAGETAGRLDDECLDRLSATIGVQALTTTRIK
jgi:hypothetical protein